MSGVGIEQDVAERGAGGGLDLDDARPAGGVVGGGQFGEAVAGAGAAGEDEFGGWRWSPNEELGSPVGAAL